MDPFSYPVVIRKIGASLVFSVPDLGLYLAKPFEATALKPDAIARAMRQMWEQIADRIREHNLRGEKPPTPSRLGENRLNQKHSLLSQTYCASALGLSRSSIERMIGRGVFECVKTPGGHSKIKRESFERYLSAREKLAQASKSASNPRLEDQSQSRLKISDPLL